MKKLIEGIVDFRKNVRASYNQKFSSLAAGQKPDSLFIACSDSRVVPNLFASTDPGDLFVVRNVGNLIPPCCEGDHTHGDESEAAALEFAVLNLNVSDVIVCGHSECGAMQAILAGRDNIAAKNLKSWLRHGEAAYQRLLSGAVINDSLTDYNQLSQINVLLQIEHLLSYPEVQSRVADSKLRIHAWWFDLKKADVYSFSESEKKFMIIDEESAKNFTKNSVPSL